jgi:RNA polymerase sigma-70 factor, ECF subfamily
MYARYAPMVYRRCLRFFPPEEAEDAMHEVFVQVMQSIDSYKGESALSTWLYSVATNHCLKRLRKKSRRAELWRENLDELVGPRAQKSAQEAATMLAEIWRELPEELLTIGMYRHGDGLSQDEIAELIGVSRRTVGNRLEELQARVLRLSGGAL